MSFKEIESIAKDTAKGGQKGLVEMIKDAVRSTTLSDSQVALIRDTATEVGISNFKDILGMSPPTPKSNLEKFIMLKMKRIGRPDEVAEFLTKILKSETQADLAATLELPEAQLIVILPSPTIKEIFTTLFKKFLVTFFVSFCVSFVFRWVMSVGAVKQKYLEYCAGGRTASVKKLAFFKFRWWTTPQAEAEAAQKLVEDMKTVRAQAEAHHPFAGGGIMNLPDNQIEFDPNTGSYRVWAHRNPKLDVAAPVVNSPSGVVNPKPADAYYLSDSDVEGKIEVNNKGEVSFTEPVRRDGYDPRKTDYDPAKNQLMHNKILCGTINWATLSLINTIGGFFKKIVSSFIGSLVGESYFYGFIAAAATSVLLFGSKTIGFIFRVLSGGVSFVIDGIKSLWDMATKGSKKLARLTTSRKIKYAAAALDLSPDSSPDEIIDTTSKSLFEVVKDKTKDIMKYFGAKTIASMRELASEVGMSSFKKVSLGLTPEPRTPLEKIILKRLDTLKSPREKIEFLNGLNTAESQDDMAELLGVESDKLNSFFEDASSRAGTLVKYLGLFSLVFLLGAFAHVLVTTPAVFGGALIELKAVLMPLAKFLYVGAGYQSAGAFYAALATSAAKSSLITTSILGILMYGPSWIRNTLGAIGAWVKQSIMGIWSKLKDTLMSPFRKEAHLGEVTPHQALVYLLKGM